MLCKHPFYQIRNFILYFVSLLLTSPSFCYLLDYSAHFCSLLFTSSFGLSYLRIFPTILVYVMFYLRTISDSRMFIVPILTWLIRNTVSVLWNLLVHRVATIHKSDCIQVVLNFNASKALSGARVVATVLIHFFTSLCFNSTCFDQMLLPVYVQSRR